MRSIALTSVVAALFAGCAASRQQAVMATRIAQSRSLDAAIRIAGDAEMPPAPSWFTSDRSFTYPVVGSVERVSADVLVLDLALPPEWRGDAEHMVFDIHSGDGWHRAIVVGAWQGLWVARFISHPVATAPPRVGDKASVDYAASWEIGGIKVFGRDAGQQGHAAGRPQTAGG